MKKKIIIGILTVILGISVFSTGVGRKEAIVEASVPKNFKVLNQQEIYKGYGHCYIVTVQDKETKVKYIITIYKAYRGGGVSITPLLKGDEDK